MHRERVTDFWVSLAVIVALFVPIWGLLLLPSGLIRLPIYLFYLGVPAVLAIATALVYAAARNRVLLNRFLIGYAAGFAGTAMFTLFEMAAVLFMPDLPNVPALLGNAALGRPLYAAAPMTVMALGFAYHFLLNGAAWGAAYALLFGKAPWWQGLLFGFFIWAVLVLSPPFYAWGFTGIAAGAWALLMLLIAHFIYGGVVGALVHRWVFPEIGMEGMKAVRPLYA